MSATPVPNTQIKWIAEAQTKRKKSLHLKLGLKSLLAYIIMGTSLCAFNAHVFCYLLYIKRFFQIAGVFAEQAMSIAVNDNDDNDNIDGNDNKMTLSQQS